MADKIKYTLASELGKKEVLQIDDKFFYENGKEIKFNIQSSTDFEIKNPKIAAVLATVTGNHIVRGNITERELV